MTFQPTFSTEIEGCRFMFGRIPLCAEDVPADVIINVCHLPGVTLAPNGKEVFWFPINESAVWGYATLFAAKKVLDQKLRRERKSVYLHCEQGQIRSMLVAMLWLQSFGAGADEALENRQWLLESKIRFGHLPVRIVEFMALSEQFPDDTLYGLLNRMRDFSFVPMKHRREELKLWIVDIICDPLRIKARRGFTVADVVSSRR